MYGYIYLTTNKVNNKKYIGQHARSEFDESYYGKDNFTCEVLNWAETKEELDQLEIDWIAKCEAVESEEYYNIAPGGDGIGSGEKQPRWGRHHSVEAKAKISVAKKGKQFSEEHKRKISENHADFSGENHPLYGTHPSEETKAKISEANRGENNPRYGKGYLIAGENNPRCRPVVQLTLDGEFVREFQYIKQAEQFGFNGACVSGCCRGKSKTHKGYKWMYLEDYEKMIGGES